ncbi:MAG: hypothetical protein IJ893_02915 [Bacteroidales bacterium]|nr:hypothetical protein [Bacteroidales bacterium]
MIDLEQLKPMVKLTVGDLLEDRRDVYSRSTMYHGRMIAKDARSGKILFDTRKNKRPFVEEFFEDTICAMWVEMREIWKPAGFSANYEAVLCCYVHHTGKD